MRADERFALRFGRDPGEGGITAAGTSATTASRAHVLLQSDPARRSVNWSNLSSLLPAKIRRLPEGVLLPPTSSEGGGMSDTEAQSGDQVSLGVTTLKIITCHREVSPGDTERELVAAGVIPGGNVLAAAPEAPESPGPGEQEPRLEQRLRRKPELQEALPQELPRERYHEPDPRPDPGEGRELEKVRAKMLARVANLKAMLATCEAELQSATTVSEVRPLYSRTVGAIVTKAKKHLADDILREKQNARAGERTARRAEVREFQAKSRGIPTAAGRSVIVTHGGVRVGNAAANHVRKNAKDKSKIRCLFWKKPQLRHLCEGDSCPYLHEDRPADHKDSKPSPVHVVTERGTVRAWKAESGYGFIAPDTGGANIYAHVSDLVGGDALKVGSAVQYERVPDPKQPGKHKAVRVHGAVAGRRRDVRSVKQGARPIKRQNAGKQGSKGGAKRQRR